MTRLYIDLIIELVTVFFDALVTIILMLVLLFFWDSLSRLFIVVIMCVLSSIATIALANRLLLNDDTDK